MPSPRAGAASCQNPTADTLSGVPCLLVAVLPLCRGATQGLKMIGEYFPWTSGPSWTCSRAVPAGGVSDTSVGTASKCGRVAADAESAAPQSSHFVYLR